MNIKLSIYPIVMKDMKYNWKGEEITNDEFTSYAILATQKLCKWLPIKTEFLLSFNEKQYCYMYPEIPNLIKNGKDINVEFIGKDVHNSIHHCTRFKNKEHACLVIDLMHQNPNKFILA